MNVAFVGAESHFVYTKSSHFFIETLRQTIGAVKAFSNDWLWIHLPLRRSWDLVVFWQYLPETWELDLVNSTNIVVIPMYDNCPKDPGFWARYANCKVLCFSRTLADLLGGYGLRVYHAQYYPPVPAKAVEWGRGGLKAFFWPRKPELNWSHVRPLMEGTAWERIHLHVTDKLSVVPLDIDGEDARVLPLRRSTWFASRDDYVEVLGQHQVFFASRRSEGIGMSFLEALSQGMAVIAPDGATMNEYIRSGENGYLYDPERPVAPPWTDAREWGEEARRRCQRGRDEWLRQIPKMRAFLLEPRPIPAARKAHPRRTWAILEAWPAYLRYRAWRFLLAARRAILALLRRAR